MIMVRNLTDDATPIYTTIGDKMNEETGKSAEVSGANVVRNGQDQVSPTQNVPGGQLNTTEESLDIWRIMLVDMVYLLSSYFMDVQYWEGVKSEKDTFDHLMRTLKKLSRMPEQDGTLLIRFRGFPGGGTGGGNRSEKSDYVVLFGKVSIDKATTNAVTYRQGIHMSHLSGRLSRSFDIFAQHGISTLYLKIPGISEVEPEQLRVCLHIISHYKQALKTNEPIVFEKEGRRLTLPLVYDEQNQPDLNLILLAGLNRLTPKASERLVRQVDSWLQQSDQKSASDQYIGVYNTIFRIKSLKDKLKKPPIEINNVKWLKVDIGQEVALDGHAQSAEDNFVPQAMKDAFGELPERSTPFPEHLADINFENIDPQEVGQRLQRAFELIDAVATRGEGWEILEEVIQSIQGRFELAGESVFDSMNVEGDVLKISSEGKEIVIEGLNQNLLGKVEFHKNRSVFKKNMRTVAGCGVDFDTDDYQGLAEKFDIPAEEIKKIIALVKSCFDDHGHFLRAAFDRNVSEFVRYPHKVFAFLWQYLKEPLERKDRVAFLNSLQHLIGRMDSVQSALRVLLADLCHDPADVSFSDRNVPMFACILLRKFNKELNMDIEVTPEEVLMVKEGLDAHAVKIASEIIESHPEIFLEKIQTIQQKIVDSLKPDEPDVKPMPLRYLLSLEREIHILLALVGGETALSVLRTAVKRYGSPSSEIYRFQENQENLPVILQHLKVAIRGLGRIGEKIDLTILEDIQNRQSAFLRLGQGDQHESLVMRIMEWIDVARQSIFPNVALDLPQLVEKDS
jgi:hypothetical protein